MQLHVDVLGRLHTVWGVFGVLTGTSLGLLAAGMRLSLGSVADASEQRTAVWLLVALAGALVVIGAAMIAVGRALRRWRPRARPAAIALAVANLVIVPFGTALGVYAFWVLLNDEARGLFGRPRTAGRTLQ